MKLTKYFLFVSAIIFSLTSSLTQAAVNPTASTISLKTSCDNGSGGVLDDCFSSQSELISWIKNTRQPTAADGLTVEIAPGTYSRMQWLCAPGEGHVAFRGAGRGRTVFTDSNILGNAMTFQNCENLTFDSMTINAKFISVVWLGHGTATWQDIELIAGYTTWYETPENQPSTGSVCASGVNNEHKFFSSSLILKNSTIGSLIYLNNCGVTWFYGSELIFDGTNSSYSGAALGIKSSGAGHEVHLYGSNIRMLTGTNSSVSGLMTFQANSGAQIHTHGTGIDLISEKAIPLTAIEVNTDGMVHAAESAYVLRTQGNSTVTRIANNGGQVHAPAIWTHVPDTDGNPATMDSNYVSANGSDQAVVMHGTSDGFPHPAIYSTQCPSNSSWYDTVDKVCRSH